MPTVHVRSEDGVAVLTLDHPPANAISRAVIAELMAALDPLERDLPRALVVTSAGHRFFSAGLDLLEVYPLSRREVEALVPDLVTSILRVFRLPVPVVAAVNGHAVAGGAVLALAADHRIASRGNHVFGLNEVQVGVPLPAPLYEVVRAAVDPSRAARMLLEGRNASVEEALVMGLVTEVVDPGEIARRSADFARQLAAVPRHAYRRMKELLHAEAEAHIRAASAAADPFIDIWFEEETRRAMGAACERLKARKG